MSFRTPITVLCLALSVMCFEVSAADHGHGRVHVTGSIVDTACAIAMDDRDQIVDIGSVPMNQLLESGRGPDVPFQIHLVNCTLNGSDVRHRDHWKDVHITFEGRDGGDGLFVLSGEARGEALSITDAQGNRAIPGEPMPNSTIIPGSMTLRYKMRLEADHHPFRPGPLRTTLRYFMDYE